MAKKHVIVKNLPAIQNLGSANVLCTDKTGTITSGHMTLQQCASFQGDASDYPLLWGARNSRLQSGISSPLDVAILAASSAACLLHKVDEIPFDFVRRRLSVVAEDAAGLRSVICKGAPESVLPLIASVRTATGGTEVLSAEAKASAEAYCSQQSAQGRRMLAVATRSVPVQKAYDISDETSLTLEGFLSFEDPPLPETPAILADLHREGVRVVVITGDNELVARHVCEQAGLPNIVLALGKDLDSTSDAALLHVVQQTNLFARVSPNQKLRIVSALMRAGNVVAFLGDGVNDAPALHAADVGIAAPHAVDVAQEAADIVMTQPGLQVIHSGIREGRKAFGNVMKYLLMGTSSNFGNVLSMAAASAFLPFLPMLPTQVLLNNFLYDLSQLTIPTDSVDGLYYAGPQRWNISVVRRFMLTAGPISSAFDFLTFFVILRVLHASVSQFRTAWFVESLVTQTLVLLIIRTAHSPLKSRPSRAVLLSTVGIACVGIFLPYSPIGRQLQFVPLSLGWLAVLVVIIVAYLSSIEWLKRPIFRTAKMHT